MKDRCTRDELKRSREAVKEILLAVKSGDCEAASRLLAATSRCMKVKGFTRVGKAVQKCYRRTGGRMAGAYPEFQSTASVVEESTTPPEDCGENTCLRPPDELRGDLLQWVELVRKPGVEWPTTKLQSSADVYRYLRDAKLSPQENLYVLMLNNQGTPLGHVLVARGTQSEALVNPSDVLRPALLANASRIIVAHNHPSGDPAPSSQDVALTKRIAEAGTVAGVTLLDHIVVGRDGYASLRDMGMIS